MKNITEGNFYNPTRGNLTFEEAIGEIEAANYKKRGVI